MRLSALGDVIHTIPSVVALRNALGASVRIGWVVEQPYAELVSVVAPVDTVIRVATKRWRRKPLSSSTRADLLRTRTELRDFGAGTAVDFQGLLKSSIIGFAAGASRRIGFATGSVRERLASSLYTDRVSIDPALHVVEWNLALACAAGASDRQPPRVDYSAFAIDATKSFGEVVSRRPVVLLPGAGRPQKEWNIDRYAALADRLSQTCGAGGILVAWGPGERHLAERIAAAAPARVAPPTDLRQLAFLLQHARIVIGGDTGPLHLADALGTPVVGLYGPTDPARNGPYSQRNRVVETWSTTGSMSDISVDAVAAKTDEVLRS